jgi:hypothetical protein
MTDKSSSVEVPTPWRGRPDTPRSPSDRTPRRSDRLDGEAQIVVDTRASVRSRWRYQTLATTIADDRGGAEAAFQVYPADPLGIPRPPGDYERAARSLTPLLADLEWEADPYPVEPVENELALALANTLLDPQAREAARMRSTVLEFSFFLVREPVLPFRGSPIEGKSLVELLAASQYPGTATGAFVGLLVAGGGPLLFITVPGGMIVGGAAWAVASALERGLHEKILRWLGVADTPD